MPNIPEEAKAERLKDDIVSRLRPTLGAYAVWLARYGRTLSMSDRMAADIKDEFALFERQPNRQHKDRLISAIDDFCTQNPDHLKPAEM